MQLHPRHGGQCYVRAQNDELKFIWACMHQASQLSVAKWVLLDFNWYIIMCVL